MKPNLSCALAYNVHDSSVSFALYKRIVLVLEAERIFKEKKKRCNQIEMEHLVQTGLSYLKRNIEEVAFWSMTTVYNPFLNTSDIYGNRNSTPLSEFWKEITCFGVKRNVLIVNHHLAHAATFLLSPFSNALIISCDGGGDYDNRLKTSECQAVFTGKDITIQKYQFESGSFVTGKFYGLCSNLIHGKKNQEGKLMALAGFGKINGDYISKFQEISHAVERSDYQSAGELKVGGGIIGS